MRECSNCYEAIDSRALLCPHCGMERDTQTIQIRRGGINAHYQARAWGRLIVLVDDSKQVKLWFGKETGLTLEPGEHTIALRWPYWHIALAVVGLIAEASKPYIVQIPSSDDLRLCCGVRATGDTSDLRGGSFFGRLEVWEC